MIHNKNHNASWSQYPTQTQSQMIARRKSNEEMIEWVNELTTNPKERGKALQALCVKREQISDLAIRLWTTPGTMTVLLSEIISTYPYIAANNYNIPQSNRVCNVLALLQCVAGHDQTRKAFIEANFPIYLFPFLHQTSSAREAEYFKLTSLGIIGSLVRNEEPEVITYLLNVDFVPLCLRILKFGQEISRIVAAFIVQKILSDNSGRASICSTKEKVETVVKVFNRVVNDLTKNFSTRLAQHVVSSYNALLRVDGVEKIVSDLYKKDTKERIELEIKDVCDPSFRDLVGRIKAIWNRA